MMRRVLRIVTALLAAWVECAGKRSRCFLVHLRRLLSEYRLNKLETMLFVLALSLIVVGFLLPGESTAIFGTLFALI